MLKITMSTVAAAVLTWFANEPRANDRRQGPCVAPNDSACYHRSMPQLLVRNVPLDVVDALKRQASLHGRSAEAEHRAILEQALKAGRASFRATAAKLRAETGGRILGESADLIREDRDRR